MHIGILHDSETGAAVLTLDGRALEVIFEGSRACGIGAYEVAQWFLRRCEWRNDSIDELVNTGKLRAAFGEYNKELEAAASAAKVSGRRNYADDATIAAALRGRLPEYLAAVDSVSAGGDEDAVAVLQGALEDNDWSFDAAINDTVSTLTEYKGGRLPV
jgi:hypothetical protein